MDRRIGIALGAALVCALTVIAFLLGRQSQTSPAVVVLTPTPVSGPARGAAAAGDVTVAPDSGYAAAPHPAADSAAPPPMATSTPDSAEPGPGDPLRAEVARYFAEIEALQQASKGWSGDPNQAAQEILKDAASGDMAGMQALADANQRLVERLRALDPPEPCAPHLQKTLDALAAGNDLLEKMKAGIQSGDMNAISALATEGQELQRQTRELDALGAAIKQQYGL